MKQTLMKQALIKKLAAIQATVIRATKTTSPTALNAMYATLGAKSLDELPQAARDYIKTIEQAVGAPIDIISTGPDRVETIVLRHPFAG